MNRRIGKRARRAALALLVLAAVAALAASAYAEPPPTGGSGDSGTSTGKAVAALQVPSDKDPWPDPPDAGPPPVLVEG